MKAKLSAEFILKLVVITLAAFIVYNFRYINLWFGSAVAILQPFFIGIFFALVLNAPMEFFQYKLLVRIKNYRLKKAIALIMALVFIGGILALVFWLAIPAGIKSVQSLAEKLTEGDMWEKLASENELMNFLVTQGDKLYHSIINKLNNYVPQMLSMAQNILKTVANILLGFGLSVMLLINKDNLKIQIKKLLGAVLKKEKFSGMDEVTDLAIKKFSRYLGGQITEAFILGVVCYLFMLILRLPYAPLVSLIIGFVNLIPIVGAYLGGALCAIIIFAVSPLKALIFIIFIIILQQVESMTTYPIIVGRYVGLNSFWILLSVIVWGGLLGFWGMLLGVPFTAFLQDYISLIINRKKQKTVTS